MPMKSKVETNSEKMEIGNECYFHIFNVSLTCFFVIFFPLISEECSCNFQNCITVAFKCLVTLPWRSDSASWCCPIKIFWQNIIEILGSLLRIYLASSRNNCVSRLQKSIQVSWSCISTDYLLTLLWILTWQSLFKRAPFLRKKFMIYIFQVACLFKEVQQQRNL